MKKILIFIFVWFVFGFLFFYLDVQYHIQHVLEVAKKHDEIINHNSVKNRVFIAGSSSALTAINSTVLNDLLGKPVYNIALGSEAFDYKNEFALIKTYVKSGDTVLYSSMNLFLYSDDFDSRAYYMANELADMNNQFKEFNAFDTLNFIPWKFLPSQKSLTSIVWNLYDRKYITSYVNAISDNGDYAGCNYHNKNIKAYDKPLNNKKYLEDLIELNNELKSKNVKLYVFFPRVYIDKQKTDIWELFYHNESEFLVNKGIKLIRENKSELFRTSSDEFCDMASHIQRQYSTERTNSLLNKLKEYNYENMH